MYLSIWKIKRSVLSYTLGAVSGQNFRTRAMRKDRTMYTISSQSSIEQ